MRNMVCGMVTLLLSISALAETVPGEYLVRLRSSNLVESEASSKDIVLVKGGDLDKLRARDDVALVQPNFKYRAQVRHSLKRAPDPLLAKDHDLELANAINAWDIETGDRRVVVAVLDTGVDYRHEDLAANIWHDPNDFELVGWDFVSNDADPDDVLSPYNPFTGEGNMGHGTHCAGNVGAVGENGLGTSGIAQRVSIMSLRVLDEQGAGDTISTAKAVDWAVEHGAHIISASWGTEGEIDEDAFLKEAIKRAETKGVLFVAAAGNTTADEQSEADNDGAPEKRVFPASFDLPNIISVAAINQNGKLADFSYFGAKSVHLAAPGESSLSTVPDDGYRHVAWDGTSMAAPQVAGAAALLLARNPEWTYARIKKRLLKTVRPERTLRGRTITGGMLDVERALKD